MVRSSIADRYLKTLETNAIENAPKSPPRSIKSPQRSQQNSPLKSPSKFSAVKDTIKMSPKRSAPESPIRSLPTTDHKVVARKAPQLAAAKVTKATTPALPKESQFIGPRPDRHPLLSNQDLSPSEVSWDKERQNWRAYEYLCHIAEAKQWMEKILGETLPSPEDFPESLQNGTYLAKIVQKLRPDLMKWPVFEHKRLQYRHTENIALFFDFMSELRVPQLFLFDMTDLYEKRNLPKVIYCIHAVSHFVTQSHNTVAAVDDLVGKLKFSDDQLMNTERGIKGRSLPNFGEMTRKLSGKHPRLEPLEDTHELEDSKASYNDLYVDHEVDDSMIDRVNNYKLSDSEDEDSNIRIAPPRRYRNKHKERDFSSRQSSLASLSSIYNERYSQYDRRQHRGSGYRNLSSTGLFRSKILSAAEAMLLELEDLEPEIIDFQAICRGKIARKHQLGQFHDREAVAMAIKLQSLARGALFRRKRDRKAPELSDMEIKSLISLQSLVRGLNSRQSFRKSTGCDTAGLVELQSIARGKLLRLHGIQKHEEIVNKDSDKVILAIQSGFRGVILRFRLSCMYDDFESCIPQTVALQSLSRGVLERRRFKKASGSWNDNVDKIVTLQSIWRARAQGRRYNTLLRNSNPTLESLKPFLHLYEDNEQDYKSELELESIMRDISKKLKTNESFQSRIDQLDMKIALLVKNNINIDEILLQQQKKNQNLRVELQQEHQIDEEFGNGSGSHNNSHSSSSGLKEQFDIKLLQKTSRERFELYQGLLYILQTQTTYLSKIMDHVPPKSLDMAELVLSVFGDAKTKREQFYLLKQLANSITQSNVGSPENTVAWQIVSHLNHTGESAKVAKAILAPATEKLRALSEKVLDYDPHLIYEHLTGGADLDAEEAIQDPAVRALFVQNLRWLREVTQAIVHSLTKHMAKLPYHIKFIGREVFREILRCTNDREEALSAVGQVVISQFLQPALLAADSLELVDVAVGNTAKNLGLVGHVLHQVGVMLPFAQEGSTDIYLRPLNEFVKASSQSLSLQFQSAIIECPDLQSHFNMSEFDDITMHERPALHIKMDNLLALHYMSYNNISTVAPSNDNTLLPLVQQLGPLPSDSREMLDLARFKEVKLDLNPKYCSASLNASTNESSSLLATTKRCLVYVLQIQNSEPDLMSVLVSPVEIEDELRFNLFLDTDNNREVAGELANLTFRELKLLTLEKVLELESSGTVSRENDYQTLINAIANDIRNKDSVRMKKTKNIENKRNALESLGEKGNYLQQRLDSYSKHINEALETLQLQAAQSLQQPSSKRFQKFQLGNKLNGHTDVSKDQPKYGQYRSNADKLYERGILVRLLGYSDRQRKDVFVTFSCENVSVFQIDVAYKGILLPNGHSEISLDDLLAHQYQNSQQLGFVGGDMQLNTNRLLQLILEKFFNLHE